MNRTPSVWLETGTIQTVWPSRYVALKRCMLREAAAVGNQDPLMPMSPRAQLGSGIHSMFERAATDPSFPNAAADFAREWDKMVEEAELKLSAIPYMKAAVPITRSIPNIGLIRSRTLISLADVRASAVPSGATPGTAQSARQPGKLSNKAGTVVGVPDRVTHTPDGVVISDFKTGAFLQSDGTVSPEYQAQLQLYAALFHENHRTWPLRLEIVSISGARIPVPATPKECEKLLNDAHKLGLKARNVTPSLANNPDEQTLAADPKTETCRFCPFRPRCPAYLAAALSATPLCPSDVAGTLRHWSRSGNGAIFVEIESTASSLSVRSIAPVGPAVEALNSSRVGDNILIVNLRQDTPNLYTATNYTAVHAYQANRP